MRVSRLLCVSCVQKHAQHSWLRFPQEQPMPLDLRPRPGLGLWSHLLAADTQALPARTLGPCSPPSVRKLIVGTCPLQPSGQTPWSEPHLQGSSQHPQRARAAWPRAQHLTCRTWRPHVLRVSQQGRDDHPFSDNGPLQTSVLRTNGGSREGGGLK